MNAERHLKLVDTNGELAGSLCPDCVRTEAAAKFVKRRFCSRVCSGAANGRGFASGRMAA